MFAQEYDYIVEGVGLDDALPDVICITGMWISNFEMELVLATTEAEQFDLVRELMQPFQLLVTLSQNKRDGKETFRDFLPPIVTSIARANDKTEHVPLFYTGFSDELLEAPDKLRWWVRLDLTDRTNCSGLEELLHSVRPPLG